MPENDFEKFMKEIPEGVAVPLESEDGENPAEEGEKILSALEVVSADEKVNLLPRIKETIARLKDLQNKNIRANDEFVRNTLMRLIAEEGKIEANIN